ncbi:MAG: NAD(+) synthase [Gemmatales bacterium]
MPLFHHGFLRVAVASPRVSVANPSANVQAILQLLKQAEAASVAVTVFPELCLTGYTCSDLFQHQSLQQAAFQALHDIQDATRQQYTGLCIVGLPWAIDTALYNVAAVVHQGELLGIVPKSYLPNYKEFYEQRWFASASKLLVTEVPHQGKSIPCGIDLLFSASDVPGLTVGVEICEDLWMPVPPSSLQALHGATVLANLSASTEVIGKATYRRSLVSQQSARCLGAYLYAASAVTESTTDVIFSGHGIIAEAGTVLAEGERFQRTNQLTIADIDLEKLQFDRRQQASFSDASHFGLVTPYQFRHISFELKPRPSKTGESLQRRVDPHPFVPKSGPDRDERCAEVFSLQTAGLAKRLEVVGKTPLTLGVSGGLDSTLALLVACQTLDILQQPRSRLTGYIMPGFGSTSTTKSLAHQLLQHLGVPAREMDIRLLCLEEMKQLGHSPFGIALDNMSVDTLMPKLAEVPRDKRHDLVFENVQARMRTSLLMNGGFVIGTGDLSELALGWCTYNGDQISMYNPNVGVPKTLVRYLIRWVAGHHYAGQPLEALLHSIADQVITPELLPTSKTGEVQSTEASVGPYELQDFYLYHFLRFGFSRSKLLFLASQARFDVPYTESERAQWLDVFLKRFFVNQFKRSCLPDGPKVGSVSLSPRGDWRMPSDASGQAWLEG